MVLFGVVKTNPTVNILFSWQFGYVYLCFVWQLRGFEKQFLIFATVKVSRIAVKRNLITSLNFQIKHAF